MRRIALLLWISLMMGVCSLPASANEKSKPKNWAVYYGSSIGGDAFRGFNTLVFDSDAHPPLMPLKASGRTLLGYISLGEAEQSRFYFDSIKRLKLLLAPNPDWPGHHIIDIRKPEWQRYVLEELIPYLLHQGFAGIFLDTLDSPLYLETKDPKKYAGMKEAGVKLVKAIRLHYPGIKIMLNRGFDILPEIAGTVDMVLAESTYASYDFKKKSSTLFEEAVYQEISKQLLEAKKAAPNLEIYTLDYWDMNDVEGVSQIYAAHRAQGFIPYVADIGLQQVYQEPGQ